jgi:HSP20 family molecular chaperone IbpA
MAGKDISVTRNGGQMAAREETRTPGKFLRPAVDIFETEEGLTLIADLPGVDKEGLDINIEKGILTIQGRSGHVRRGSDLYREFELGDFYRQFQLPDEIDASKVAAQMKDGVLALQLPKAEAARPRRIEIISH